MTRPDPALEPLAAPFYAPPYGPAWSCKGFKRISVVCEVGEAAVQQMLANTPFVAAGTRVEIFVDDLSGHSLGAFNESGITLPVRYENVAGLFHAVVFVTSDVALLAGREVFGYPKLLGTIDFVEDGGKVVGTTVREGQEVFRLEFAAEAELGGIADVEPLAAEPTPGEWEWTHHLLVKSIPSPQRGEPDVLSVLYRNIAGEVTRARRGSVKLEIGSAREVAPVRGADVVAAYYLEGDFGRGWEEDRRTLASLAAEPVATGA
jgi:hypothetical protein